MTTDRELLHRYVREGAEEAFDELVRRHIDLVYSTALRQLCGNAALAEDVTQAVFATLANKAEMLAGAGRLSDWLYTATRVTVQHTQRMERRRPVKESSPARLPPADEIGTNVPEVPAELVDASLLALDEDEREAVLLRVFEDQSFFTIGAALGKNEESARASVARAFEKVRTQLLGRGISLPVPTIPIALGKHLCAAPPALANSVSAATFAAAGAASSAGTRAGARAFFGSAVGVAWLAGAAAIIVTGFWLHELRVTTRARVELSRMTLERDQLRSALEEDKARFTDLAKQTEATNQRLSGLQERVDDLAAASTRVAQPEPVTTAPAPKPVTDAHPHRAERLAQMKPLLAAGQPIKGAVVVMVDGKPKSQPVDFVIGKETKIDADEGEYLVSPRLQDDGSVEYTVTLRKRGTDGVLALQADQAATIVRVPWQGFIVAGDQDNALAFDPDEAAP